MKTTANAAGRYVLGNVPNGHYMTVSREDSSQSETFAFEVRRDRRHPDSTIVVNVQLKMSSTKPEDQ